ncbi:amidohydrolase family protein [Mesorhizobium sp. M0488]|uniref:amidohydrolase family protein n=1 Tax=unclassified Mesorhizobium TaxID=325217 RepID=UPI0033380DEF
MDSKTGHSSDLKDIDTCTDTREYLRHARQHAEANGYSDWTIVDVDAHHVESISWKEIVRYIDDPVLRDQAEAYHRERVGSPPYGLVGDFGMRYQDCGGRIPHQSDQRERIEPRPGIHRDVELTRRAMQGLAAAYMVVFPTSMLMLGMHPQPHMEVALARAYNRWVVDTLLAGDNGIIALLYLPFNTPEEACKVVAEHAGNDKVVGFMVTSTRYKPVHANDYMRLYRMIEETGKPICFHAGYHWQDPSLATIPTFLGMHALGFVWCNMVHMTNWVLQGIPERFPGLKSLWVESGLAWIPFLMQRLDDQFLMRQSEAPALKMLPSDYMRQHCWYSSQPMERSNMKALEVTFEMIAAETQLLWSSDWPHFDFDTPRVIHDLPFLGETAKRNILGRNAQALFRLPDRRPPSL